MRPWKASREQGLLNVPRWFNPQLVLIVAEQIVVVLKLSLST